FRFRRPRHDGLKDILAGQRHIQPGASHGHESLIVVDLAQSRTAILVSRSIAMVLDCKSPDLGPTLLNIGYGILVFVIHDVSTVIADAKPVIADFVHDASAIPASGRVA